MKRFFPILLFVAIAFTAHAQLDSGKFGFDGPITTITKSGNLVYVGGNFGNVGYRTGSGAVVSTKTARPYLNFPVTDGYINASAPDGHGGWFIGGNFTHVGDSSRLNLAHINADGSIAAWHPNPDGEVLALQARNDTVFIGGNFTYLEYLSSRNVIIDKTTADILSVMPNVGGDISAAIPDNNNGWYLGGMTNLGDSTVGGLAHIDSNGIVSQGNLDLGSFNVQAMVLDGNNLYVGGGFDHVYQKNTSILVSSNNTTGVVNKKMPNVNGTINVFAPDGKGGFFIGGDFNQIGDSLRRNFAEVDSTGTVTALDIQTSNPVNALKISDSILYIGGSFSYIQNLHRPFIAALNLNTNTITSWNPTVSNTVNAIEAIGDSVYVGGAAGISGFYASTGKSLNLTFSVDNTVHALLLYNGRLYIGGSFTYVNKTIKQPYAVAVDIISELPTSWNPSVDNAVYSIVAKDSIVYLGGEFQNAGGTTHYHLIATDTAKGSVSSWTPFTSANDIFSLFIAGDTLYAVGDHLAASFTMSMGNKQTQWDPGVHGGTVNTVYVYGKNVYLGGTFLNAGGQNAKYLISIDTRTWQLSSWRPNPNYPVSAMHKNGNLLYISGSFTAIGDSVRNNIASVNLNTMGVTSWNPNASGPVADFCIGNHTIYAIGTFKQIGGTNYSYLAAVDSATGKVNSWNPAPNSSVQHCVLAGNNLYISGYFTSVGTSARNYLAEVNTSTGAVTSWNPGLSSYSSVNTMVLSDTLLLVGARFNTLAYPKNPYFASFGLKSGNLVNWDINQTGGINGGLGGIYALFVGTNRILVTGNLADPVTSYFAAISAKDERLLIPDLGLTGSVSTLCLYGNRLYMGGNFLRTTSYVRNYLAALTLPSLQVSSWNPVGAGATLSMVAGANDIYVYGNLANGTNVGPVTKIDASTGKTVSWDITSFTTHSANTLYLKDSTLYLGGNSFNLGGNNFIYGVAAVSTNTAKIRPLNMNLTYNDNVRAITSIGKTLYVAGGFDYYHKAGILAADTGTGVQITTFHSSANSEISTLNSSGDSLFVGGKFSIFDPVQRSKYAVIDADSLIVKANVIYASVAPKTMVFNDKGDSLFVGTHTTPYSFLNLIPSGKYVSYASTLDSQVNDLYFKNGYLYIAGNFSKYGKTSVKGLFVTNGSSTYLGVNWNANVGVGSGRVRAVAATSSRLFVGGTFTKIGGSIYNKYILSYPFPYGTPSGITAYDSIQNIIANNTTAYCFGTINTWNNLNRDFAMAFDNYGTMTQWNANTNGYITAAAFSSQNIYISGYFDNVWSQPHYRLAALDTVTGKPTSWQPDINLQAPLSGMTIVGDKLFGIEGQNVVVIGICTGKPLQLTGSRVCGGNSGKIYIIKSYAGASYTAYINNKSTGADATGNGDTVTITIPSTYLTQAKNTFTVEAVGASCGNQVMQDTVSIFANIITTNIKLVGGTICSGGGTVLLNKSQKGITYEAFLNGKNVGSSTAADTLGVNISIPSSALDSGDNYITVKASQTGCVVVNIPDSTIIRNLTALNTNHTIIGDTVCLGTAGEVMILNADPGVTYKLNSLNVSGNSDTAGNLALTIPPSDLKSGLDTFSIIASNKTCGPFTESTKAEVLVETHSSSLSLGSSVKICGDNSGYASVKTSLLGVKYYASINGKQLGLAQTGNGGTLNFIVPSASLKIGSNYVTVSEASALCSTLVEDSTTITLAANCDDNDASITSIVAPSTSFCAGSMGVNANLINTGGKQLNSVKIGWSVNGKIQTPYSWSGKLAHDSIASIALGAYTFSAGSDTIIVWSYLPNGITDSTTYDDTSKLICTILNYPLANAGTNSKVCSGKSITIGANPVSGNSYSWVSNPPGFSSKSSNPVVNPSATTTYILTETNATGCSKTDSVTISVDTSAIAVTGPAKTICSGNSDTIGTIANPDNTYSWVSYPASFTSSIANPVINPKVNTIYILTEKDAGGCMKTDSVTITVSASPNANAGKASAICNGNTVDIGSSAVIGDIYTWKSSPIGFTSSLSDPTVNPQTSTTYYVKETNKGNCSASDSVIVTVYPLPDAYWTASMNKCEVTFLPKSSTNKSYLWHFGDGDTSVAYGPVHDYTSKGGFKISLITLNQYSCKSENDSIITISELCPSGINTTNNSPLAINVYPNPFNGIVMVQYTLPKPTKGSLVLYDMEGKQIEIFEDKLQDSGEHDLEISSEKYHLHPGVYMLRIITEDGFASRQIVKL